MRERRQKPHQLCIEQISVCNAVFNDTLFAGVVQQYFQNFFQFHRGIFGFSGLFKAVHSQLLQYAVYNKRFVTLLNQPFFNAITRQIFYSTGYHALPSLLFKTVRMRLMPFPCRRNDFLQAVLPGIPAQHTLCLSAVQGRPRAALLPSRESDAL